MVQWLSTFFRLRPQQPSRIRSSTASSPPLVMFWTCLYELIINCVFFNTVDYVKVDLFTILKWSSNCLCLGLVSFFFGYYVAEGSTIFLLLLFVTRINVGSARFRKEAYGETSFYVVTDSLGSVFSAVLMFWLGSGTKATWSELGKDYVLS